MSAEEDLQEFLQDYARCGGDEASTHAKHFLDIHAHELAEKIREDAEEPGWHTTWFEGMTDAANLIDPQKESTR